MPTIAINGAQLHYTDSGGDGDVVLFSHGLLFSSEMYRAQIEHLSSRYRCIAWDHRGQGRSAVTEAGYDMDSLAEDAAALIRALGIAPVHFVGLSMGGFVGMRLAARHGELLRSLTLLDTSAEPEPNARAYRKLVFFTRWLGPWAVADKVMPILFGQSFLRDPARAALRRYWRNHIRNNDRWGMVRSSLGVIERKGVRDELARISTPTLVVVGEEDVATAPEESERIAAAIPGARLERLPGTGHMSAIENPDRVNALLDAFLAHPA